MKIKRINQVSFEISTDSVSIVTDPKSGDDFSIKFPKTESDVALFTEKKYEGKGNILSNFDKLVPKIKKSVFEINGPGEYEISQVLVQRPIGSPYYIIDSEDTRIVYIGFDSKEYNEKDFEDLGDVEVLIAPVGNGSNFVEYDKLQEIISDIEPGILIPNMYDLEGLKTKSDFLHYFGYSNSTEEKILKVTSRDEDDESPMKIIFLN